MTKSPCSGASPRDAWRAGVEGTIAEGARSQLRQISCFGQAKAQLAHLMTAAAMNLVRLLRWLPRERKAESRHGAFALTT